MSRRPQATIPEPYTTLDSLHATAMATKELVESLAGQRGSVDDVAVTWGDLIRLGLIKPEQVDPGVVPHRP
jgi:hypothetical protein